MAKRKVEAKNSEELKKVDDVQDTGQHKDLRDKILQLKDQVENNYWELSSALYNVYKDSLYMAWGFESWKSYVEEELDFAIRKAQYLVAIQEWFGKLSPNVQEWIKSLGWTKAKELVKVVTNENAAEWKAKIQGKSVKEILDILKGEKKSLVSGAEDADGGVEEKPAKLTFTLYPGQKENVETALEKAKELSGSDKAGNALDLICTEFLSMNAGVGNVSEYLGKVEALVGMKLIGYDPSKDEVVYGADTLDSLAEEEESE